MSFLDVVLQAEVSRYEDADFAEYALRCCDEHPDTRDEVIKILRNMIFANWNPAEMPTADLLRLTILMCEIAIMQPKLQILGFTLIVDLEGFSVQHARHFSIDIIKQLIHFLEGACPLIVRGIHIINSSWLFNTLFNMSKPFLPAAAWEILYFHGSDPSSLRRHIDRINLPPRYGGTCQYLVPSELWLTKIKKYKDDILTEELRDLGYIVND